MTNEVHVSKIIETALTVSTLLGDALDRWGDNMEESEAIYDAMDALWYAIEEYKKSMATKKLVANA